MNRAAFLSRVREAAQRGRAHRVHLHEVPDGTGYVGAAGDLCEALAAEVEAVGGSAHVVNDREGARAALNDLLRQYNARSAYCWQHPVLDRLALAELLREENVETHRHDTLTAMTPAARKARILAADIGISSVDVAIAETGTLVVCSRPGQERLATLLPPVHVAIVDAHQIVPDLFDAFERLDPLSLASNIALITGPSKTGDIELQLTTGVHGPGKWHVIVIRNAQAMHVD